MLLARSLRKRQATLARQGSLLKQPSGRMLLGAAAGGYDPLTREVLDFVEPRVRREGGAAPLGEKQAHRPCRACAPPAHRRCTTCAPPAHRLRTACAPPAPRLSLTPHVHERTARSAFTRA